MLNQKYLRTSGHYFSGYTIKHLAHVKTECKRGEGVEGGARCPAYGF